MTEESNRLDKIAELEAQLAELKSEQKDEQTYDTKSFKEIVSKDMQEYIENADENELVNLYNAVSDNEAVYNEQSSSILVKTPETSEIIADAEESEQPDEEVVSEKEKEEDKDEDKEELKKQQQDPRHNQESVEEDDMGEEVEIEKPVEDEYTNDLDPQK